MSSNIRTTRRSRNHRFRRLSEPCYICRSLRTCNLSVALWEQVPITYIIKVIGRKGRITIPYDMRMKMKITHNDVLRFEQIDEDTVLITRIVASKDLPESFETENPAQLLCNCLDVLDSEEKISVLNFLLTTIKKEKK